MNFRSAGKETGSTETIMAAPSSEKYYPSLYIDLKDFPEMDKGIGEEFECVIRCKVKSKSLSEDSKTASIEICEFGFEGGEEEKDYPKNEADRELHKMKNRGRS